MNAGTYSTLHLIQAPDNVLTEPCKCGYKQDPLSVDEESEAQKGELTQPTSQDLNPGL